MAETQRTAAAPTSSSRKAVDWANLKPKSVGQEDAMDASTVRDKWVRLMSLAGLRTPNEDTQNAFKLAVYAYLTINGTSREGNYAQRLTCADGHQFDAAVIPRAVGKSEIRRFMRGDMMNAYEALKHSAVMQDHERFVARVSKMGINPEQAFATADFFQDCPFFTPLESSAYEAARNYGLVRAAKSRGGTLEAVEKDRLGDALDAQGAGAVSDNTRLDGRPVF